MKYLILLITAFWMSTTYAQECISHGHFVNSENIKTSGDVEVKLNKKGKVVIAFASNFHTEYGPDLDIYLSKEKQVKEGSSVRLEALISFNGPLKYTVSKSINISEYKYIVIHCTQYNHWYGTAELESCK